MNPFGIVPGVGALQARPKLCLCLHLFVEGRSDAKARQTLTSQGAESGYCLASQEKSQDRYTRPKKDLMSGT